MNINSTVVKLGGMGAAIVTGERVIVGINKSCASNPECLLNVYTVGLTVAALLGVVSVTYRLFKK